MIELVKDVLVELITWSDFLFSLSSWFSFTVGLKIDVELEDWLKFDFFWPGFFLTSAYSWKFLASFGEKSEKIKFFAFKELKYPPKNLSFTGEDLQN